MIPRGQDPTPKEILSLIEFLKKQVAGERCNSVQVLKSWSPKILISLVNLKLSFAFILYQLLISIGSSLLFRKEWKKTSRSWLPSPLTC